MNSSTHYHHLFEHTSIRQPLTLKHRTINQSTLRPLQPDPHYDLSDGRPLYLSGSNRYFGDTSTLLDDHHLVFGMAHLSDYSKSKHRRPKHHYRNITNTHKTHSITTRQFALNMIYTVWSLHENMLILENNCTWHVSVCMINGLANLPAFNIFHNLGLIGIQ
jgi:hypothetical protein